MVYITFIHVLTLQKSRELMSRVMSRQPGKLRIAVSLQGTIKQFIQSSLIAVSEGLVRETIDLICTCTPWFCQVIKLNGEGCMSSQSSSDNTEDEEDNKGMWEDNTNIARVLKGKENLRMNEVEGLLIFAKREGKFIGREDILKEFRLQRLRWEGKTS